MPRKKPRWGGPVRLILCGVDWVKDVPESPRTHHLAFDLSDIGRPSILDHRPTLVMSIPGQVSKLRKVCFVTVGATASFDSLIKVTLNPHFLEALRTYDYTDLQLQYGKDGQKALEEFRRSKDAMSEGVQDLSISGFDFNKQGLGSEMRAAKGEGNGVEGVVISHAGSGSILDALRIAVPIIVVPNPDLLDNHQEELAEELAIQGYVVHGHLDDLPAAIRRAESLRKTQKPWPPKDTRDNPSDKGLIGVMDDELGFVD